MSARHRSQSHAPIAASLTMIAAMSIAASQVARAGYIYTYTTSPANLLNSQGISETDRNDSISLSFSIPFQLLPHATYDISAGPSTQHISTWLADDTVLGLTVSGRDSTIERVSDPGPINDVSLTQCPAGTQLCFGGAIVTNGAGQIALWNLLAYSIMGPLPSGIPQINFITYNTHLLGSADVLDAVYTDSLSDTNLFAENTLNGPVGKWRSARVPEPPSAILFLSAILLMLLSRAVVGRRVYRPHRVHESGVAYCG